MYAFVRAAALFSPAAALSPVPGDALSGLWPQPAFASASGPATCLVTSNEWAFSLKSEVGPEGTARLDRAFARTLTNIYGPDRGRAHQPPSGKPGLEAATKPALQALDLYIASEDCTLNVSTNESYTLDLRTASDGPATASLHAQTIYGALRGLETFAQLTTRQNPACPEYGVGINSSSVSIRDACAPPRPLPPAPTRRNTTAPSAGAARTRRSCRRS